ncbi:MAG: hypothetical protein IJD06_06120 [Clostridia bacterium]|nr:hypothetical protein [Clostridia bacterium]
MKNVFLSGDSIRIGYDHCVRGMLSDVARVYFSDDNCRYAENTLRYLHEWKNKCKIEGDVDCVHWNVGLWDCLILFDDGPLTPLDIYARFFERICRRMQIVFPHARQIFATSTPVYEPGWPHPENCCRRNADIRAYNETAAEIAQRYGMLVNDLYAALENAPQSWHSDQTHFYTKDATVFLTRKVSGAICDALGMPLPEKTDSEILASARPTIKIVGI